MASPALTAAKQKIEAFMITQDVTLSVLFNVIDSNSDNQLSKAEFKQKMRGLHMGLDEAELEVLFKDLDINGDGFISYNEFIKQFTAINTTQIMKRMRRILYGASISAEFIYNKHCKSQAINKAEFKNLLCSLIDKLADFEIESIFKQLDTSKMGSIPKAQFLDWFGFDEQEKLFQTGIEDIIKPLVTCLGRAKLSVVDVFNKYDQDRNQMMSATELQAALKDILHFEMSQEEVKTMHEFFRAKFRRSEVRKAEFVELLEKQTVRKFESKGAKSALASVKKQLESTKRSLKDVLGPGHSKYPGEITLRGFKLAIHSLGCLTQQQVNNLAKYMDKYNNGMIRIEEVELALADRYSSAAPASSSGAGGYKGTKH